MFTALTLTMDVVVATSWSSTVAAVFGSQALTEAVSRALAAGPEAPRLHLVHTGAAALAPQPDSVCGSCLIQTS